MIVGAIALIMIYLGGGGAEHVSVLEMLNEMSAVIETHVEDPARAAAAEQTLAGSRAEIEEFIVELGAYQQELLSTGLSGGPDEAGLKSIFSRITGIRQEAERAFIHGQIELREHITAEEWSEMYAALKKKRK